MSFYPIESVLDVGERRRYRHREPGITSPPVETDLLCLVDRADEQANVDGEELDVGEIDLDVAGDDESFVQHAVEDVDQTVVPRWMYEFRQSVAPIRVASAASDSGSAQPPQRSEVNVEILVRETEDRLQLIHSAAQLEQGQAEALDFLLG